MTSKPEEGSSKRYALGVLFIHGIGRQRQGDTLVRWGDRLAEAINRCSGMPRAAVVDCAELRPDPVDGQAVPANAEMSFESGSGERPWRLAESWWAEAFSVPSYRQLVTWSFKALPIVLTLHVVRQFHRLVEKSRHALGWKRVRRWAGVVGFTALVLPLILLLIPVFALLLAALLVIGLVPLPSIRSFVGGVQRTLAGTAGDSLILLESPIQAAAMRSTLLDALAWLAPDCHRIAIVAHSQGAALAIETLGVLESRGPSPSTTHALPQVELLVTLGAGINKLAALSMVSPSGRRALAAAAKQAREEREPDADSPSPRGAKEIRSVPLKLKPVWYAVGLLIIVLMLVGWIWYATATGRLTTEDWVHLAWFLAILTGGSLLTSAVILLTRPRSADRNIGQGAALTVSVLVILAGLAYALVYDVKASITFLLVGAFAFVGAAASLLSIDVRDAVRSALHPPDRIRKWLDFYASSDPVPNGKTVTRSASPLSTEIYNSGSMLNDHTEYWSNVDGFVIPVTEQLLEAADSPLGAQFPQTGSTWRKHAARRVRLLGLARSLLALAYLGFIVGFGFSGGLSPIGTGVVNTAGSAWSAIPGSDALWDGTCSRGWHDGPLGTAALAVLWFLGYMVLRMIWWMCLRAEQVLAYGGEAPPSMSKYRLSLTLVVLFFVWLGLGLRALCY